MLCLHEMKNRILIGKLLNQISTIRIIINYFARDDNCIFFLCFFFNLLLMLSKKLFSYSCKILNEFANYLCMRGFKKTGLSTNPPNVNENSCEIIKIMWINK